MLSCPLKCLLSLSFHRLGSLCMTLISKSFRVLHDSSYILVSHLCYHIGKYKINFPLIGGELACGKKKIKKEHIRYTRRNKLNNNDFYLNTFEM